MDNKKYPNVLIVNQQGIDMNNATGITLRSIWKDWPDSNMLELCIERTDNVSRPAVKRLFAKTGILWSIANSSAAKKANSSMKTSSDDSGTERSLKKWIRQALVACIISTRAKVTPDQMRQLERFKPDLIYSIGSSVIALRLVYQLSKRFDISVVMHFMDNWVEHSQWEDNILLTPYRRRLSRYLDKCMRRSKWAITISDMMARRYEQLFNVQCCVLMNSVDVEKACCAEKTRGEKLLFVYAGGLHLNRADSLKKLAGAMKDKGACELHIYTYDATRYEMDFAGLPVKLFEAVSHDEIKEVYEKADALVHVETLNPLILGFFKYSISTKIPEYLASGRPVLFFGPKEMGLYSYLEENGAALCVSDADELPKALRLLHDASFVKGMCENAYALALKNHQSSRAGEVLYKVLNDSIS